MRVEELMTSGVVGVGESATLGEARDQMESLDVHALPVTDADGALVGIVSTQDLVTGHEATLPVSRIMTSPVHTVTPDEAASAAAALMREHRQHHAVVVDDQAVVGMISSLDLLKLLV